MNEGIRRLPPKMVTSHLKIDAGESLPKTSR
jgi:hypothetical protein